MTMGKALIVHESGVMDDRPGGLITRPGSYAPLLIWKNGFMRQQENVKVRGALRSPGGFSFSFSFFTQCLQNRHPFTGTFVVV